ncbi:MAG: Ig-like domain repeat protein [Acidobacteriota bacterium]|nr:Ig-like domain repeat protein [Acidobacteriota bacterium]
MGPGFETKRITGGRAAPKSFVSAGREGADGTLYVSCSKQSSRTPMGMQSRTNPACEPSRAGRVAVLCLLALWGSSGRAQSPGPSVALRLPSAIAYDAQGDLFIAERTAHRVQRLAPDGTLTVVAGTGTQGYGGDGGPGTAASLDSPSGLAVDASGNVLIADTRNHRVRRLTVATGTIATVAGTGVRGFAGDAGPATSARLDRPVALALAANGDLYVAEEGNHRVRRIASGSGVISTVAGNGVQGFGGDGGPAVAASIDSPEGIALDAAGDLYVADMGNHRVRRVDAASGIITTVAGVSASAPGLPVASADGGAARAATLGLPRGLSVGADGSVYVADAADHRIRRIAPDGTITTVAGSGPQQFAGDEGPAAGARLDSPAAVTLSPPGLVTLADTGNQRIRQVDAAAAPGPDIHTLAGLRPTVSSGALTLTGPAVSPYGSGSVSATLAAGAAATGLVSFLDSASGASVAVGSVALSNAAAALSLASLPAGQHLLTAVYQGDATHAPAQSQGLAVTVTPLAVSASAQPLSVLYGQPIPPLNGTLSGVLPQDAAAVSAVFSSTAAALSPVGSYPVSATLSGSQSRNYTLVSTSGGVTIASAPTAVTLVPSVSSALTGDAVTLTIQAVSSTAGTPTGAVALLDGGAPLSSVALVAGSGSYTTHALSAGVHPLSAVYTGDTNFLGSTSPTASVTVSSGPDFALAVVGDSGRSIPSGSSAVYSFSMTPVGGALDSPIALTVDGLPVGATSSLNPAYLPPGGQVTSFTLTVQTTKTAAAAAAIEPPPRPVRPLLAAVLSPMLLALWTRRRRRADRRARFPVILTLFASTTCVLFASLTSGCGDRVNAGSAAQTAPTYSLTVSGTATSASGSVLKHSAIVTLQVL